MEKTYISVADTAKLVRASVKEAFPGVKFSVRSRSYSMGASIDVSWTDGPNSAQVDAVVKRFQGSYFDGMIDYKGTRYATLDGALVRFSADFVFAHRSYSDAMIERAIAAVLAKWGEFSQPVTLAAWRAGNLHMVMPKGVTDWRRHDAAGVLITAALTKRSTMVAQPSPTAARVAFAGDDGYGAGTVGMPGTATEGGNGGYSAVERATWKKPEPTPAPDSGTVH
jgi:hypothetical protein